MLLKYTYRIFLLLSFLKIENSLAQIYCPAEELFFGPVVALKETIYELPERAFILSSAKNIPNDTLRLTYKSTYKVKNGLITEKQIQGASGFQQCRCTKNYSKKGQVLEKTTFGPDDRVDTKIVNTWSNDRLIRKNVYDVHNEIFSSRVYIHDSVKRTEVSKEVFDDHEENIVLTELNPNHKPLKSYTLDSIGSKKLYAEFGYDSLGRVCITHFWNVNSKYDQHYFTTYDSLNRAVKRDWFTRDNIFMGADSIVYDTHSNIVFEHSFDFITGIWSGNLYKYQLDEFGNFLVKETWSVSIDDSFLKSRIVRVYSYDE